MKITLLVGHAQEATVIVTAFNSFDEGVEWLNERVPANAARKEIVDNGNRLMALPLWRTMSEEELRAWFSEHCFKSYYDGCGGVDVLTLMEIEPGSIHFAFSLD